MTAACPSGIRVIGPGQSGAGGGGGGGGGAGSGSIIGSWRNVLSLVTSSGETIVTDTRWTFGSGGGCSRVVIQTFVNAGIQDTTVRNCTYTFSGSAVTVTFEGSSVATRFSVAFASGDLLLDGFRFTRIG